MLWVGLDVVIAVVALCWLGSIAVRLWRQVKALARDVAQAGDAMAAAGATAAPRVGSGGTS